MLDRTKRINSTIPIIGIYSVVNKINNKIYIGQSIDIERRWEQHKYGKGNLILRNSIKKNGIENFEFNILETIDVLDKTKLEIITELTQLEQKWFDLEKPFLKENAYNIQKTSKPNLTPNRDKHYGEKISKIKIDNNHTGKPLIQYCFEGKLMKEWKSAAEVERELNFKAENISACCLKKVKSSNGYIWRFKGDDLIDVDINCVNQRVKPITRKINQISFNGNLLKVWSSLKEITLDGRFNIKGVKSCCDGKRLNYKDYKWSWIE